MSNKFKGGVLLALAAIMVAGLIAYYFGKQIAPPPKSFNTVHQSAPDQSDKAQAESDWEMTLKPTGVSNRVLDKGLQEARTDNPRKAANTWVDEIKRNPYSLAGQLKDLLPKQYSTVQAEELYVKKGNKIMPSDKAKEAVHDLYAFMERARISKASAAEVKGYNTGLVDGQIVRSDSPVIVGDKTAIKLEVAIGENKGKTYYILARCGNLVLPEKTPVPVGKTDQPEPEYQVYQATKTWKNVPAGTTVPDVTFKLIRDDKVVVSTKVLKSGQTSISFGRHITKAVDGRRHTYTVQEIVPDGYEMSRNGNHFVNTHKTPTPVPKPKEQFMSITVNKRWVNGLDKNPPKSVKVNLLQDGKVYDYVRLSDHNNWRHTFSKLPVYNKSGARHSYRIEETDIPADYSVSYDGYTIINTYKPPKTPPPPTLTPKSSNPKAYKYAEKKPGNNKVDYSQAENTPPRELRSKEKAQPAPKERPAIEKEEIKEYKEGRTAEERHEMAVKEAEPLPGGEDLPPNDGEIEPPSNPNGP
jgi:collagen adhesin